MGLGTRTQRILARAELFEGESAVIRIESLALDLPLKEIYARIRMD